MGAEETPIVPRKVTEADKQAAADELVPHLKDLGKHQAARLKLIFGQQRGLTQPQVEFIILEVKRRLS